MPKLEKELYDKETLICQGKINFFAVFGKAFALVFFVIALELGIMFFNKMATNKGWMETAKWIVYVEIALRIVLYLPFIIRLLKGIMTLCNTKIVLTSKRIIGTTGSTVRLSLDAPLSKIDNISISEGGLGRIFRYATIKIMTNSAEFNFKAMSKARDFKKQAMEIIEKYEEEARKSQAVLIASELITALNKGR